MKLDKKEGKVSFNTIDDILKNKLINKYEKPKGIWKCSF